MDRVVASFAEDHVGSVVAVNRVVARTARDEVIAVAPRDRVVTAEPQDAIRAIGSCDRVVAVSPQNHVRTGGTVRGGQARHRCAHVAGGHRFSVCLRTSDARHQARHHGEWRPTPAPRRQALLTVQVWDRPVHGEARCEHESLLLAGPESRRPSTSGVQVELARNLLKK
jgi:hypothetical protein